MDFRKKSATILFGVMVLGISSSMLVSAVNETSNFENKTLQIVGDNSIKDDDTLASDLKNENEYSFLYTDNTNRNANSQALGENKTNDELLFIDHTPENKVKSGLSRNVKIALGSACGLSGTVGSIYAVKKFVLDKRALKEISQGQEKQEQQDSDKKEENEKDNSQGSGTSGNNGNNETGSQGQTSENQGSNSGNSVNLKVIVPIVAGVLIVVATVVTLVVRKLKSGKILADGINIDNSNIDNVEDNNNNENIIINNDEENNKYNNVEYKNNNENIIDEYKNNNENIIINNDEENNKYNNVEYKNNNENIIDQGNNINNDEENELLIRDDRINSIMVHLGFDKDLAGKFYDLLLDEEFEQAAKAASKFFGDKFDKIYWFGPDPGFDYGGIINKVGECIGAIKYAYNERKKSELVDGDPILKSLGEITNKCNNKILELKNWGMGNFGIKY